MKYCSNCRAEIAEDDLYCGECGTKLKTTVTVEKKITNYSKTAGSSLILAGIISLSMDIFALFTPPSNTTPLFWGVCVTTGVVLSMFALIGGILTIKKKLWLGALICAIIGIFSFGFLVSSGLCLGAIILIIMGKKEFES